MQNPTTQMFLLCILQAQMQKPDKLYNRQAFPVYLTDTVYNNTEVKGKHCQQDYSQFYNIAAAK
jgi:uncharacterized UBP type Zn finger protein